MNRLLLSLLIFVTLPAMGQALVNDFQPKPDGGRVGLHGMVLFGSGPYFLDHIPMLTPPHDYQVISQVILRDGQGQLVRADFSKGTFTLKPAGSLSLNDLISGKLKSFKAAVYDGGFEQGGQVAAGLGSVTVEVEVVKMARPLPASATATSVDFRDGSNVYQVGVITPRHNVQQIRNKTTGQLLWCVTGPDFFDACP